MKKFKVLLQGNNFLLNIDGVTEEYGFYTTRYVEAHDELDAENKSVELIRNDSELKKSILNKKKDPPMIYLDSIEELLDFKGIDTPGSGYTFYSVNADE